MLHLGILAWILIGAVAGWTAGKIMKTAGRPRLLLDMVVGILGGLGGGLVLDLLGVDVRGGGIVFSFVTCVVGACALLFALRSFGAHSFGAHSFGVRRGRAERNR